VFKAIQDPQTSCSSISSSFHQCFTLLQRSKSHKRVEAISRSEDIYKLLQRTDLEQVGDADNLDSLLIPSSGTVFAPAISHTELLQPATQKDDLVDHGGNTPSTSKLHVTV
jgi:hypothetical protein